MKHYKVILPLVAIGLCVLAYVLLGSSADSAKYEDTPQKTGVSDLSSINIVEMKKDSFVTLMARAYGTLVDIQIVGSVVQLNTISANQMSVDIFNGATGLLGEHAEHGFTINYNNSTNATNATFTIKAGMVQVPTDVLFAAMKKLYNQKPT
jgi:hypothetical protein